MANRLALVANKTIGQSQTAFQKGRNILEGVVILHETLHELQKKKQSGLVLKIDFEKAYDKVSWQFLQQVLRMKGFSQKWCMWIDRIVSGGNVGVMVNDELGHFFQTKKGLRQGDPLSPLLFNIAADMLAILIDRSIKLGHFQGLIPHLVEGGVSILQYADDTVLFLEDDLEKAENLKLVLCAFEKLSGLKINFHKSEIFLFGEAKDKVNEYVYLFGCKEGAMPFKYLGIPMSPRKLSKKDWALVEERFQKKLASWKGKVLSSGGRLVLINSVLSSLPMFMMSFFRIPKGVLSRLNYYRSRFYWQCDEHKKKYRLAKWSILCKPKSLGGLGIIDLDTQNKCLLSKWMFKLFNEEGKWQELLRNKYLRNRTLTQAERRKGDSQFWSGLMEIKDEFLAKGRLVVGDGNRFRFWEDWWIGNEPLMNKFPSLYDIVRKKNVTVAKVMSTVPLGASFRRGLSGENRARWFELVSAVLGVQLHMRVDSFVWSLGKTFTVKSMYNSLMGASGIPVDCRTWKLRVPLKIKIFLWYLKQGVILTKDNLAKRQWKGCTKCCFCENEESIQHLFFECPMARLMWFAISMSFGFRQPTNVSHIFGPWISGFPPEFRNQVLIGVAAMCWALWLCRNDVVFQRSKPNSCLQVIFRGAYWIRSWAILSKEEKREELLTGCRRLETAGLDLFGKHGWNVLRRLHN
jgi:hypothetical protein